MRALIQGSSVNIRGISDEGHTFVDTFSRITADPLVLSDTCIYSLEWLLET